MHITRTSLRRAAPSALAASTDHGPMAIAHCRACRGTEGAACAEHKVRGGAGDEG